jgi:hypothetical protein
MAGKTGKISPQTAQKQGKSDRKPQNTLGTLSCAAVLAQKSMAA